MRRIDEVHLRSGSRLLNVRVPVTDIKSSIDVNLWRALLTLFGLVLVVTDIPRTGLVFHPPHNLRQVVPGIIMFWGPYEYPVVHLEATYEGTSFTTLLSINASTSDIPLESVDLWPYKFDTLSIAPRAVARLFNLTSFPPCVTYHESCSSTKLAPNAVFHMLDELVTSVATRAMLEPQPLLMITKTQWIDRLHHVLVSFLTKNPESRLHAIYHMSLGDNSKAHRWDPRQICGRQVLVPEGSIPFFCRDPIPWKCDQPSHPTERRKISVWDHISIRIQELQQRYSDLELDIYLLVTTFSETAHRDRHILPCVGYTTELLEITTIIRGRQCTLTSTCRTMFIDEYRYERIYVESDKDEWRLYLTVLRAFSQIYIWIRIVLLVWGCQRAIDAEQAGQQRHWSKRWLEVVGVMLKVPSHTIAYSSWLPVIGYALAHYFDGSLEQTVGEFSWSSVGGFYIFHPFQYVITASIQMRNIWMLAIIAKLALHAANTLTRGRWTHADPGILTIRGGWIAFTSWLTTYSLMRAIHFRNTNVESLIVLPSHTPIHTARRAQALHSFTDYGIRFDLKCGLLAALVATGVGWVVKTAVWVSTQRSTSVFTSRSQYFPLSAGSLFAWSSVLTAGSFQFVPRPHRPSISLVLSQSTMPLQKPTLPASCDVCHAHRSPFHWRAAQGCLLHEPILDPRRRSTALWSMVRLSNLAYMTDPIVFFRLRVRGVPLSVYRVDHPSDQSSYLLVLPTPRNPEKDAEDADAGRRKHMTLVATVSSRDVPWHALLNCG